MMIEKKAYTFTGQGSQRVGMWDDLRASSAAEEILEIADKMLKLSTICSYGPAHLLMQTEIAQPAILAHSLGVFAVYEKLHEGENAEKPLFYLGHSIGEITALAAAKVIDIPTAIELSRKRGILMKEASSQSPGSMMALIGFKDQDQVEELCEQTGVEIANYNSPNQIVISGGWENLIEVTKLTSEKKIRTIALPVSGPFHSSLMVSAQKEFKSLVDGLEFSPPEAPIIPNATAMPTTSVDEIKDNLVRQLSSPVLWYQSVGVAVSAGVKTFLEFGPRPILTNLLSRMEFNVKGHDFINFDSIIQKDLKITLYA